jgi:hypothetical protein
MCSQLHPAQKAGKLKSCRVHYKGVRERFERIPHPKVFAGGKTP